MFTSLQTLNKMLNLVVAASLLANSFVFTQPVQAKTIEDKIYQEDGPVSSPITEKLENSITPPSTLQDFFLSEHTYEASETEEFEPINPSKALEADNDSPLSSINSGFYLQETPLQDTESIEVLLDFRLTGEENPSVILTWEIQGYKDAKIISDHYLDFKFSQPILTDNKNLQFDEKMGIWTLPADSTKGDFEFRTQEKPADAFIVQVTLRVKDHEIAQGEYKFNLISDASEFKPSKVGKEGGQISGLDGLIEVEFPDGALSESVDVWIKNVQPEKKYSRTLLSQPFEIIAENELKHDVSKFNKDITIKVAYYDGYLSDYEEGLTLFFYNEETQKWEPLPSWVDAENNILYARSSHLTDFSYDIVEWEPSWKPSLNGFQNSLFTGAATYSHPLTLPAAPGGLTPTLNLSYNSQVVDEASIITQGSWVGMGWSLETGSITRNINGTQERLEDDTFTLTIGDFSSLLIPGADGYYHTQSESFWRIKFTTDTGGGTWTVWDKTGNKYSFGTLSPNNEDYRAQYPSYHFCADEADNWFAGNVTWNWPLTEVKNQYSDQIIRYTYFLDWKYAAFDSQWRRNEIAVYPESIIYPGGRYRVWFERDANLRTDVEDFWDNRNILRRFLRYRLNEVRIEHDSNWDGLFDEIIRKYVLTYESNPSEVIYPGVTWTEGGKTLTLKSIREFGKNNAALPATTFDYDEMHLTTAENGYGGRVEFQYETEPWHSPSAGSSHGFRDETAKHCCFGGGCQTRVAPWNGLRGKLECMGYNINIKDEPHTSNVGEAYIKLPKALIYPGGKYQVYSDYQHTITVGIGNSTQKWYSDVPGPENGNQISRYFLLPKNYANQNLWGLVLCEGCLVGGRDTTGNLKYEVNHLLTRYRVTQKTVKDTLTNETSVFSYNYALEKTNTRAAGATCPAYDTEKTDACYFEQNSQFLGNGKVVETGPNNLVTITRFLQSEDLLGKISSVEIRAGSENGTLIQSSHYIYESTQIPTSTDPSFFPHRVLKGLFTDMHIYWPRLYSEETRNYDNQGYNYIAVKKQYEYDPFDQNPSNLSGAQYGNVTRVTSYSSMYGYDWKGLNTVRTRYYPTVNDDVYLVGLPAIEGVYGCNGSVCNVGYTSQLSSTWYLYDGNTVYSQPLSTGKLTGLRTLLRYDGADGTNPVFRDERYGYDAWGNRNSVTVYRGEGSASSPAAGTEQITTTCYGAFGGTPAAPQCVDDTYHTYPGWQMNAAGQLTRWNYDKSLGVPVSETDPNGVITTASYDNFGRLTSIVRPPDSTAAPSFSVAYHDTSPYWVELQQKVDNGNATTMRKFYNGLGQLIQTQSNGMAIDDGSGGLLTQDVIVDYIYDDYGRVTHQSMPYAVTPASGYHTPSAPASEYTVTDYDLRGRVVAVTPPNGAGQTISYGMAYQGDLGPTFTIDSSDANGHTTQTLKDAWERVVKVIPEEGSPVSYAYDGLGKLIAATTGVGTVAIQYDLGGRKLSMNDPDMGSWSYTYNALGELTAQTDARGCTSNLAYDALGRVTSKTFSGAGYCGDTPTVAYYYDGQGFTFLGQSYGGGSYTTGRRTAMLDGSGMTAWSYDQRGRVVSETRRIYSDTASTQAEAFTTQWSYNSGDLPVTTTYPDGETLAIEYDRQGKPLTMANTNAFTYVRDVLYDEAGRMTGLGLGDTGSEAVIQRNYSYYPWDQSVQGGRMSSLTSLNAASATLQSLAYTYDAAGNLTQISDERADEISTFSYDGLDRLTGMSVLNDLSETVHSEVFTYDEAGRMSAKGPDAQSLSAFSYDPQHPHAVNGLGSNTYSYDNNGNQVTRNLADLQYELSYDAENHLVDVDSSLAPSPTPTATPTTTPTATLYSIYLPMVVVVPNNATPTPAATANPTTPATPAATTTPTPEITPTATSVIAYPMLPQEEPQTPAGRQPQQTPKPAPQATPAPETANPSARGANTHPLQLPPNRPALAQDPTQEPSPTPTATPVTVQANYLYDGDGNLARGIVNGVVTFYPGRHYNRAVDGANVTVKKFYTLGSSTVAVRTVQGSTDTLNWILGDHLGSTTVTANVDGSLNSELRYTAFGEVRYNNGLTPTDYRYTGQLEQAELGLVYFVARFYDPVLTHFVQADTIIPDPGDPLAWDRYSYASSNPIKYNDPTGHCIDGATTLICIAVAAGAGAIIGAGVDAYIQQKTKGRIDGGEVLGAAAAGAVSAVVLTVAAPATLIGAIAAGGAANVLGNQAGALAQAVASPTGNGLGADFAQNGGVFDGSTFTNLDKAAVDFAVGGIINGAFTGIAHGVSKYTNLVPDPFIQPKPSYNNAMIDRLPGTYPLEPAGTFAPISKYTNLSLPAGYGLQAGIMKTAGKYVLDTMQEFTNQSTSRNIKSAISQ